jgi:hypothetical protein
VAAPRRRARAARTAVSSSSGADDVKDELDERPSLITVANVENYRAGARRVLSVLPEDEFVDVSAVDAEAAGAAFNAEHGKRLSAAVRCYVNGFRRAVSLFRLYVANPDTWHERVESGSGKRGGRRPGPARWSWRSR